MPYFQEASLSEACSNLDFFLSLTIQNGVDLTPHPHSEGAFLVAQLVKNPPAMQKTPVQFLGWEGTLERHRLPTPVFWPGESHGLFRPWCCRVGHDWATFTSLPHSGCSQRLLLLLRATWCSCWNSVLHNLPGWEGPLGISERKWATPSFPVWLKMLQAWFPKTVVLRASPFHFTSRASFQNTSHPGDSDLGLVPASYSSWTLCFSSMDPRLQSIPDSEARCSSAPLQGETVGDYFLNNNS